MPRPRDYPYGADITSEHLSFQAGDPCLNFANTRELRKGRQPQEFLHGYADLLVFSRRVGLHGESKMVQLELMAKKHPRLARASFIRALELRESIYPAMTRVAEGKVPEAALLGRLSKLWRTAVASSELVCRQGDYRIDWKIGATDLDAVWWPIASAVIELLRSERRTFVKECRGVDCGWLFIDSSRNKTRAWCSMKACGNRAKAARYYARHSRQEP